MTVFLLDIFLAGMTQPTLPLGLTAAATLLGVLLTVCKVVIGHLFNLLITTSYSLWNVSLKRVRFMMLRPRVNSSVYSISLPTLTPRARMVILTSG